MTRVFGCQICLHVLNRRADDYGLAVYEHPLVLGPIDHRPVPVPADRLPELRRLCDFCGSGSDPLLFVYRTHPISALALGAGVERVEHFGTDWSACDMCSHWISTGNAGRLLQRATSVGGLRQGDIGREITGHLQSTVMDNLRPGRVLVTTAGAPQAVPAARILPKVRDRLAALLRGPDLIETPPLSQVRHDIADGLEQARLYFVDEHFSRMVQHAATALPATTVTTGLPPAQHGLLTWSQPVAGATAASWTPDVAGWQIVEYTGLGTDGRPQARIPAAGPGRDERRAGTDAPVVDVGSLAQPGLRARQVAAQAGVHQPVPQRACRPTDPALDHRAGPARRTDRDGSVIRAPWAGHRRAGHRP
ncbi:hypothetical protein [Catellatospora sp. NPDC049609]|uniref:hypothetical protein n=1 Tax=Catellatospora sp. NPDC049609 TaxID=3155505 RepID=UPI003414F4DF